VSNEIIDPLTGNDMIGDRANAVGPAMSEHFRLSYNARRILAILRVQGPQSRAEIARLLDITPSTVTRLTGSLIKDGMLGEASDPSREGQKGYPAKLLYIEPGGVITAGVYVDPDRIMTCLSDLTGTVLSSESFAVPDRSFVAMMTMAGESVRRQVQALGLAGWRVAGCGVSYPGQYSEDPTRVMRIRQFQDWPAVNVTRDLPPYFGMPVHHMNDAKAACLAELYHGACTGMRNFCHIWLSYGIGGAAVVEQRPYFGRNNGAAEWGGLFPKSQPRPSGQDLLDTLTAAGVAIDKLSDIADHHLEMAVVTEWRDRAAKQLQWLCLVIARTYAPEAIVIGGTLHPQLIEGFLDVIRAAPQLGEDFVTTPPRLLRAARDNLPQLGAAALPLHHLMNPATYAGHAVKGL
jgi:predicted NBD/HSP70 family sugar kinase